MLVHNNLTISDAFSLSKLVVSIYHVSSISIISKQHVFSLKCTHQARFHKPRFKTGLIFLFSYLRPCLEYFMSIGVEFSVAHFLFSCVVQFKAQEFSAQAQSQNLTDPLSFKIVARINLKILPTITDLDDTNLETRARAILILAANVLYST